MSTALTPLPIRLFCDLAAVNNLFDLNRSAAPSFYRGDDIQIDIGIGLNGAILPGLSVMGAGGIAGLTAQIFKSESDTNAPMMSVGVLGSAMNLALTQAEWTNNAAPFCHASFVFPNAVTGIDLGGAASVNYWLRITAVTTDSTSKLITLLDGPITVKDGPNTALSAPPTAGARFFTVGGQLVFQILDPDTGLYHTLIAKNDAGVETLEISDTGY